MQSVNLQTNALSDLIEKAHSPYHCSAYCMDILKENGFKDVEVIKDFCDNDRVVKGRKTI